MAQKFLNGIEISGNLTVDSQSAVGGTVFDVQGSQGQLFSITNSLTGDLFSVSDISGIPILNVNSSGVITLDGEIHTTGKLNIGGSTPVADSYSFAQDLVIKGGNSSSDGAGITIVGNGKRYGVIAFGDAADANAGEIYYDHTNNDMNFRTNGGSTLFVINSSGNVSAGNLSGTNTGDNSANTHSSLFVHRGSVNVTTASGGNNSLPFDNAHTETKIAENSSRSISYTGASAHLITSNVGGSASVFQLGAHYNGDDFYQRVRTDGSGWKDWRKLYHDNNDTGILNSNVTLTSLGAQGALSTQDITDIGNLSGTNTGDQTLPTDFYSVAAANAQFFSALTMNADRNIVSGTDLSTDLEAGGTFSSYGAANTSWNAPGSYGGVVATAFTSGIRGQHFYDIRHNETDYSDFWFRSKNNLGYTPWAKVYHNQNHASILNSNVTLSSLGAQASGSYITRPITASDTFDYFEDSSAVSLHQFNNSMTEFNGNYNATSVGASFGTGVDSKFGTHGLNTQGDGVYVDIAGLPTIKTVSLWYKAIGSDNGYIVDFRHDTPGNGRGYLYTLAGSDQYINRTNDTTTSGNVGDIFINGVAFTGNSSYQFTSGNWYHIVITTNSTSTVQTWDQGIRIGNRSDGSSNGNAGYFDQVRTFNRRLVLAEVKSLYSEVETGATADQTAAEILSLIKTVDGASSGLDADLLDGQQGSHYLAYGNMGTIPTWNQNTTGSSAQLNGFTLARIDHAEDFRTYTGLNAAAAQAKRYHVGRLYGCPAHWDGNWQNIEIHVTAESYESANLRFAIMGDYGGADTQANMMKLYLKEASGPYCNHFRFVLGSPVDAGWDHSGQDTYYVDLFAEVKSYGQFKMNVKTYGHVVSSVNPTSGGATTVFYDSPTVSNITAFTEEHTDVFHLTSKIYHESHKPTYTELGQMPYSNLSSPPTIPTDFVSAASGGTFSGNVAVTGNLSNTGEFCAGNGYSDRAVVYGNLGLGLKTGPKVAYPGYNAQWSASSSSTGQIVIDLPGTLNNYDMMYMEIDIYEYSAKNATKLIIGGHNWNSGGNSNTSSTMWHNVGVTVLGDMDKAVYFGRRNDGTSERRCIAIGEVDSTWSYGTVHVSKISGAANFYTNVIDYCGDWEVAQTTSTSYFTKNPTTNFNASTSVTLKTHGKIYASNFSGSSSGANTGDQDLSTYATETFVGTAISNLVDSSPAALNTLNELAAALGDDADFATTTATALGNRIASNADDTFTGILTGNSSGENLKVSGIRGQAKGNQTGQYIHLYERVHIGGPSGWGNSAHTAPANGLGLHGGLNVGQNGTGVIQMDDTTIVTAARALTNMTSGTFSGEIVCGNLHASSFTDVITNSILTASGDLDVKTVLTSRDVRFRSGNNNVQFRVSGSDTGVLISDVGNLRGFSTTSATATTSVASVLKANYSAVFFDFLIKNGTNVRAGTVTAAYDGTNVEFTETSTVDLGDTSDVTLSVVVGNSTIFLQAVSTSSTWTIKSLIRAL